MWKQRIKRILNYFFLTFLSLLIIACILPYFFSIETRKPGRDYKPYANSEFFVSHNTRIHYRLWKPHTDSISKYVVLIHGFSGSTFSFRNNIDTLLASNCMVLAPDLPAFGFSDKSDTASYNDSVRVEILMELMQLVAKDKKWTMAGHSMGASVIANVATRFPQMINKLVFIDGPAFDGKAEGAGLRGLLAKFGPLRRWAEVLAKHTFVNKKSFKKLLTSAYGTMPDSTAVNGYMRPFEYERSATAIFDMAGNGGCARTDKTILNKIPALLIWGEKDEWIPPATADAFMKQNPAMHYVLIKGAGHCSMETHPEVVNAAIVGFINE